MREPGPTAKDSWGCLDNDQIPYIESGTYVAFNDENGGLIERLREDGIVDLDAAFCSLPEWISMKAMIYKRAKIAYGALSTTLGDQTFLFERKFIKDILAFIFLLKFKCQESSVLRLALSEHGNLIRYAEKLKSEYLEGGSSSSVPQFHSEASSTSTRRPSNSSSKTKKQPKREKTEEEKTFRRRAKYFLVTQLVAVLVFLSVMGGYDFSEVEVDDDEGFSYD
ncbi:mitochondrial outer membrane import complex protein METAXIN [Populus alba x Populus x berolinensis]|nr:mitochondrial outer membrane import complex protein METAXIN [Populus alba x Populus x berolinensis]